MDATYFREKAETCLRLAKGLSWNNPARLKLMELADDFRREADKMDAVACLSPEMKSFWRCGPSFRALVAEQSVSFDVLGTQPASF